MDFAADIAPLYADFAIDVTLTPKIGSPSNGRAIHDHPGAVVLATFPIVKQGDSFVIDGKTYIATDAPLSTLDGLECTVPLARTGT